ALGKNTGKNTISIHAPREGSDALTQYADAEEREFLSTLPARGATARPELGSTLSKHFYPRSPRGERQHHQPAHSMDELFLSTLPARGATAMRTFQFMAKEFLSTLPARGAT